MNSASHSSSGGGLPRPRVIFMLDAWQRLLAYTALIPVEINGFGLIKRVGNDFLVYQVDILDQVVTPVSAVVSVPALAQYMFALQCRDQELDLKLQWHSHVHGGVYCSGTDTGTIDRTPGDWIISLVVNKLGEAFCRLDIFNPVRVAVQIPAENLLVTSLTTEVLAELQAEVGRKLTIPGTTRRFRGPTRPQPVAVETDLPGVLLATAVPISKVVTIDAATEG